MYFFEIHARPHSLQTAQWRLSYFPGTLLGSPQTPCYLNTMESMVALFAVLLIAFTAFSRGLSLALITAPITFVLAGAVGSVVLGAPSLEEMLQIRTVAELTLALVLFHDAARVRPKQLAGDAGIVLRMLLLAVPLTTLLGFLIARWIFPEAPAVIVLLLAAVLAPTDAGLGASLMTNPVVPVRIRRILNLESGFNDGLITPVVIFGIAALEGAENLRVGVSIGEAMLHVVLGVAFGGCIGMLGGFVLGWSQRKNLSTPRARALGVLALPTLAYFATDLIGGEPFIAVFVAGLGFAGVAAWTEEELSALGLTEALSEPLGMAVWLVFGLAATPILIDRIGWREVLFAILSLLLVRPLALGVSLLGARLRWQSVAFVGWFGPRGLVTLIFMLLALESLQPQEIGRQIVATAALTVLISVLAHGLTATPLAALYGAWVDRVRPEVELQEAAEPQVRAPWRFRRTMGEES